MAGALFLIANTIGFRQRPGGVRQPVRRQRIPALGRLSVPPPASGTGGRQRHVADAGHVTGAAGSGGCRAPVWSPATTIGCCWSSAC
ncbi:MAG: hypothetical protein MZU84_05345 [Sphingobacterium sp.]|nr:hypothetical protein [Sphingobacterium sp.]